jgi:tetratricopeptide (TPR) repeat protein
LLSLFAFQNNPQIEEIGSAAARRALLLREEDPIALDLMGYGYFLLNDMVTSRRFLQRALDADQGYGPAHLHLGLVDLAQGNLSEARRHLDEAINLVPGTSTSAQAERVLDRYFP